MADEELKMKTSEMKSYGLMQQAAKQSYCPTDDDAEEKTHPGQEAMENCIQLFQVDYDIEIIDNKSAKLCSHYPSKIILMAEKGNNTCAIKDKDGRAQTLKEAREELQGIMERAAPSRCRSRFVTPVIFFRGQYVCRSATLAESKELALRLVTDTAGCAAEAVVSAAGAVASAPAYLLSGSMKYISGMFWGEGKTENAPEEPSQATPEPAKPEGGETSQTGWSEEYFRVKVNKDKELLNKLNVHHICDLMVEDAKVKYGLTVSSSEKADEEKRYKDFDLISFPYPGCEFFAEWNSKGRKAEGLHYNWNEAQNNAVLNVGAEGSILRQMDIDWSKQKEWDLLEITQNYVQAMVKLIAQGQQGLLVHCISGWDRTPLFVSLLRLSLWADGLVHPSLEPAEIMYLTLAYDWYLFGHRYEDRKRKGEEVLPFCFYMLPDLSDKKFSVYNYASFPGTVSPNKKSTPKKSGSGKKSTQSPSPKTSSPNPKATGSTKTAKDLGKMEAASAAASSLVQGLMSRVIGSPKKPEMKVRFSRSKSTASRVSISSSPPSSKSESPTKSSPSKEPAPSASSPEQASKNLRKRSSAEDSGKLDSPAQAKRSLKYTMGQTLKAMERILGKHHNSPRTKGQAKKENVDPNLSGEGSSMSEEGASGSSGNKLPKEIVLKESDSEESDITILDTSSGECSFTEEYEDLRTDNFLQLPQRRKRLLAVHWIFRSMLARSEGVTVKKEGEPEKAVQDYAYASGVGAVFPSASWNSLLSLFSPNVPEKVDLDMSFEVIEESDKEESFEMIDKSELPSEEWLLRDMALEAAVEGKTPEEVQDMAE